jgi:hypothetical protein
MYTGSEWIQRYYLKRDTLHRARQTRFQEKEMAAAFKRRSPLIRINVFVDDPWLISADPDANSD